MTTDTLGFLPFHHDELAAQVLAGDASNGKDVRRAPIRPFLTEQHRAFFPLLPYIFAATVDTRGWPMASVLTGSPGFVTSPSPTTLHIASQPDAADPGAAGFFAGAEIGLIGIDFTTRRRNRANGRILTCNAGIDVQVAQSFGNCAQYIQTRVPTARPATGATVESFEGIDDAARATIATSDTFFVASRARRELGSDGGLDMSHRGGRPGFVRADANVLLIPDFRGNRFFNTLGNLLGEPRAGLLFIDFDSGDLVQLQGRGAIEWQTGGGPAGAERLWRVTVEHGWRRRGAFPFSWRFGDYAPTTLTTGTWQRGAGVGS